MSAVFLKILNMSITASWLILAVVLARLFLRKAPKWIACLLWALVAVRLLCPVSFESAFSLIPSSETIPPDIAIVQKPAIHSGIALVNQAVNPIIAGFSTPAPAESVNPLQAVVPVVSIIWIAGVMAMLAYALFSYLKLRKTVSASMPLRDRIVACDDIKAPFILGVFRPRIYVPSSMSGQTLDYVISHELVHIKCRDHWWKPLGYLLLAVYWFNPLCWIAYILLCRDIEMACDEKVIRGMDKKNVAAYSQALLDCSFPRRRIAACPLAFGEVGVKQRVKGILNYKKPAFWIILLALIVCIALAVCLMTNPFSNRRVTFTAVIREITADTMLVRPAEGSDELRSSDSFSVPMQLMAASPEPEVGDTVEIEYNGEILEIYPAKLGKIYAIRVIGKTPASTTTTPGKDPSATATNQGDVPFSIPFKTKIAYANYTTDERIFTESLNPDSWPINSIPPLPIYKFETKAELEQFKTTFKDVLTSNAGYGEVPSFNEATANYDDSFFADHTLLLAYVSANSGSFRYELQDIILNGTGICMEVVRVNNPEVYTFDMAGWFVLAEVLDSDIENCTIFIAWLYSKYGTFSYKEEKSALNMQDPGVKTEGFVNTNAVEACDPLERAKLEMPVDYKSVQMFYDDSEDIWKVHFFDSYTTAGGGATVYLDGKGITQLIVYGE